MMITAPLALLNSSDTTTRYKNAHEVEEQHAFSSTYVQVSKKDVNQPRFINAATSLDTSGEIFEAQMQFHH
jgi:7,8-dihydro-6-hydroxymethylpterin-pyrophosphokinase